MMTTQDEAVKWVAEMFDQPGDHLTPGVSPAGHSPLGFPGVLTLMAGLDEKYGILLSDVELGAMNKVGDILDVLSRQGKLQ